MYGFLEGFYQFGMLKLHIYTPYVMFSEVYLHQNNSSAKTSLWWAVLLSQDEPCGFWTISKVSQRLLQNLSHKSALLNSL